MSALHPRLKVLLAFGVGLSGAGSLVATPALAAPALATASPVASAVARTAVPATSAKAKKKKPDTTSRWMRSLKDVQLLAFNDFHGSLEPPAGSTGRVITGHTTTANGAVGDTTVDAGGAAYLAQTLDKLRAGKKSSFTVTAGDTIGATPLLSAAFHDEPSILATNLMKVDVASVGNHEFDEGYKELQRMAVGGCIADGAGKDNQNSCPDGTTFPGADYPYLAANVFYTGTNKTVLPPYAILDKGGVKVGFVGVTLKDTANIVTQSGVQGLTFGDEATAVNKAVKELRRKGVQAIVTLIHQGGVPTKQAWTDAAGITHEANAAYDAACQNGASLTQDSAIIPIAKKIASEVDMIVSGHTHQPYVCTIPDPSGRPRLVTSALANGRLVTEITTKFDPKTKDFVRRFTTARQHIATRDGAGVSSLNSLIAKYKELVKPIAGKVLGTISADVTRTPNAAGESTLGDLIADAQLADPSVVTGGKTPVIAFMNPGGIRTDLVHASSPNGEGDGVVTYEEAFAVQPFSNYLVSLDLTGAQIYSTLNEQFTGVNAASPKILQVSKGFTYTWRQTAAGGEVVPGSVKLNGVAIANDASTTYRVVTNNFVAGGGDGFTTFASVKDVYYGGVDVDAFARYLAAHSPYTPAPQDRITKG